MRQEKASAEGDSTELDKKSLSSTLQITNSELDVFLLKGLVDSQITEAKLIFDQGKESLIQQFDSIVYNKSEEISVEDLKKQFLTVHYLASFLLVSYLRFNNYEKAQSLIKQMMMVVNKIDFLNKKLLIKTAIAEDEQLNYWAEADKKNNEIYCKRMLDFLGELRTALNSLELPLQK